MTAILALNAGSSSVKFAVFAAQQDELACILRGQTRTADGRVALSATDETGTAHTAEWSDDGTPETELLDWIDAHHGDQPIAAVGHRVVHGGTAFQAPVRVDAAVLARLEELTPLAPLHQPAGLAPIRRLLATRQDLPQVACFDTAFHRTIGSPANRYAIPRAWHDEGVRRYGFHGLSYEAIVARLATADDGAERQKIVVAHLGSGASLCALQGLRSVDTSMGFSALDGIMMGTRPGSLDPGILLYLLQHAHFDAARLEQWLYHECGLLGVSGLSSDMTTLAVSDTAEAREAIACFCLSVAKGIMAMATSLGGCDRLVFTGGIGEHAVPVRAGIARHLAWLGADVDDALNAANAPVISRPGSAIRLQVIATDEERVIARHVLDILEDKPA